MKLEKLLQGVAVTESTADMNMQITQVVYDSRKAVPGCLFVAISGFATDGNRFVPMAMQKGACVVVTQKRPQEDIPYVLVDSDRLALAQISANYFDHPAKKLKLIGITGTNGKTSVTLLLKHILEKTLGAKVGLVGTMGNQIGDTQLPSERTTPESYELQALFAQMVSSGCAYAVMEVSSHAIALHRVGGLEFSVGVFTNLTEDHLDFHKTMENYCNTKAQLFQRAKCAVANCDDAWFSQITHATRCPILSVSVKGKAALRAEDVQLHSDKVTFTALYKEECVPVSLSIPGTFTVYNALCALGAALQLGIPLNDAAIALQTAKGVKGRVEVVPTPGKPYTVLIDYAHTPDGLQNVLSSVKGFCSGRLIAVFGCGGDRDPIKRPIMGKIGACLADHAIITSDNPRGEAPMAIIEDILKGVPKENTNCEVIENRVQAIQRAMDIAQNRDIIVLAGKGHETYQEICGVKHHLDEREVVADYL